MDVNNEFGVLQVQEELLKLLKAFDEICVHNNIVYSIIGGTLLGAIRHRGFIPWDDDLDVFLDRENYIKLKKILPCGNLCVNTRPDTSFWVDKLRFSDSKYDNTNILIDVFILDNLPDNRLMAFLKLNTLRFFQGLIKPKPRFSEYSFLFKIVSYFLWLLGRLFPLDRKLKWYHYVSTWGNGRPTKYKSISNDEYGLLKVRYPYDIIESTVRLKFEDIMVSGISQNHQYLTLIYGDYMTPPPMDERIPRHQID